MSENEDKPSDGKVGSVPARAAGESPKPVTPDEPLGDSGKRALTAERKLRREAEKAATDAQALVTKFEDANKSELERATAKASEAESKLAEIQADNLRLRVASESGLASDMFEFLTGTTEEQLTAQADKLKAATAARVPRLPAPDPSQGARPKADDSATKQLSRADLAQMTPERIVAAQDAGQFTDLMAGK